MEDADLPVEDPEPEPPTGPLREVYARLRDWYRANARDLLARTAQGSQRAQAIRKSLPAIDALPPGCELTDLELRVALLQVTSGSLNWSYWDKVGDRTAYELVASALREAGLAKELGEADRRSFRESGSKLRSVFPNV